MIGVVELAAARRPADVVTAAGVHLGALLAGTGFVWSTRRRNLTRAEGNLTHEIPFQPSSLNRTDGTVTVSTFLILRDAGLTGWRRAHPGHCLLPEPDDWAIGHPLGYAAGRANGYVYGDFTDGELDLTAPAGRAETLAGFAAVVRDAAMPWFAEAGDPDLAVVSAPGDRTNSPSALVEWLASRGRPDLVEVYLDRFLRRNPACGERIRLGRKIAGAGGHPLPAHGMDQAVCLGWSAARCGNP
ncbi:hypothetical protein Daura_12295 [Dactylosporangium aurantiacum]|uniref:Uncharacterized protein n=1 Tax=Dactylosporangium aurantiacum TaxID=35754 RepID=A0A9Q9IIS5_9ACTN|nr:hypothetical protein [Dactylosporangium aurantiacum]MDG6104105.1 hypothetical protein [Dactylosporangium aurantiacum]UWZ56882.1 hypothetical protein Daura_12295 [Dactylosporangium aurantiacum]